MTPHQFARNIVEALGQSEAETFALEEATKHKTPFWVDVVLDVMKGQETIAHRAPKGMAKTFDWGRVIDWSKASKSTAMMSAEEYRRSGSFGRDRWPFEEEAPLLYKGIRTFEKAVASSPDAYRLLKRADWNDPRAQRRAREGSIPPGVPRESHRVFYLGTHRTGWLDDDDPSKHNVEDVPADVATAWLSKGKVPLFISRRQLEGRRKLPRATAPWALDSGGFSELKLHGGWKLEAREYVALVRRFRDEIGRMSWAAPMDLMCEVEMTQRTGLSRPQHIERTVASYLELMSLAPDLPFIPVLQGLTTQDYYACAVLYDKHGVDLTKQAVVGLGSVCRRQATVSDRGPCDLAADMHFICGLAGAGIRLHGFGFKKTGLENAHQYFVSADSMAWSAGARHCDFHCPEGKKKCNNCLHRALEWRAELLNTLGPEWQKDG